MMRFFERYGRWWRFFRAFFLCILIHDDERTKENILFYPIIGWVEKDGRRDDDISEAFLLFYNDDSSEKCCHNPTNFSIKNPYF